MTAMEGVLSQRSYLFGNRPSLADFAVYGACAAHFWGDPGNRRTMEEVAPSMKLYIDRLLEPHEQKFGDWDNTVSDGLIGLLKEIGRVYLPWVSAATANPDRTATVRLNDSFSYEQKVSEYSVNSRSVLLTRYAHMRNPELDAILEKAGILKYFKDVQTPALLDELPDANWVRSPPRPTLNVNQPVPIPMQAKGAGPRVASAKL
jgi:hypothetical protein